MKNSFVVTEYVITHAKSLLVDHTYCFYRVVRQHKSISFYVHEHLQKCVQSATWLNLVQSTDVKPLKEVSVAYIIRKMSLPCPSAELLIANQC